MKPPGVTLQLDIDKLTVGGRGLGRHQGKAVFVPDTAPGDRVACRIVRSHRHYDEAELLELITPAAGRRVPPCPLAGACGGCQWQHLPYAVQLEWKERLFAEQLQRGGLAGEEQLLPIVAAPVEFAYRNRVQYKCRQTEGGFVAGFYRAGSHYVIDAPGCLLPRPEIASARAALQAAVSGCPCPEALPQLDISCGDDGQVAVIAHVLPGADHLLADWLKGLALTHGYAAALQVGRKETIRVLAADPSLLTLVGDPPLAVTVSAGGFAQVNPEQNRRLVAAVVVAAQLTGTERVLDLYCGAGNFTLPLARRAAAAVGIEEYAPAIADARRNAAANGIANASFHAAPADRTVHDHGRFDVVLLDPPRTGAYPVIKRLVELGPRRILYVSCDPATLVRDLQPLVHNGYRLLSSQPFDLFPQTWHVESLSVLQRDD